MQLLLHRRVLVMHRFVGTCSISCVLRCAYHCQLHDTFVCPVISCIMHAAQVMSV